jgi:hypothetical protein
LKPTGHAQKKISLDGIFNLFKGKRLSGAPHLLFPMKMSSLYDAHGEDGPAFTLHGTQGGEK